MTNFAKVMPISSYVKMPLMLIEIIHEPEAVLRQKAIPIDRITPDIVKLAQDMLETMYDAPGVGLAAPQIGYSIRLIVLDPSKERNQPMILVNPEIVSHNNKKAPLNEGCLSCPGQEREVSRYTKITVKALSIEGKKLTLKFSDFLARIIQHEVDHNNGTLIIDKGKIIRHKDPA